MKVPSDARITHVLQLATLAVVLWIGVGLGEQARLTRHLIELEKPMTTVIHWRSGNTTEVYTPRPEGMTIAELTELHGQEVQYVKDHPPNGEQLPP